MKAIQTAYNGYLFRSRLEVRWAVFFDACGVEYEYEPEGYDLENGLFYLPDFLLHGVDGRDGGDLYVEVKGVMTDEDALKIKTFATDGVEGRIDKYPHATLVVGRIPDGEDIDDIDDYVEDVGYQADHGICPFNFETIDGDYFVAHPGINLHGRFELFGDDGSYLCARDPIATERAYRVARQARFEHGEAPLTRRY